MTNSGLRQRFPRSVVLVVADLRRDMEQVRALAGLGVRLEIAGLGGAAECAALAALGIDAEGVSEARDAVLEAALDRLGAADIVLFGPGEWDAEREEVFEAERELAVADGRSLRPLVAESDERYGFLSAPVEWAAFAAALAAGADFESARKFASGNRNSGHKDKNRKPTSGGRSRAAGKSRRKKG